MLKKEIKSQAEVNRNRSQYANVLISEIGAFKADLSSLVNEFATLQSLNYVDFYDLWQKSRLEEIMSIAIVQRSSKEMTILMEDSFSHAVELFEKSSQNEEETKTKQYGSFYLIYALYYTQTQYPRIRPRFTVEIWAKARKMLDDAVNAGQWDIVYCGGRLLNENALLFAVTTCPRIPDKESYVSLSRQVARATNQTRESSQLSSIDEMIIKLQKNTNELELAQSEYSEAKNSLGTLRLPGLDRVNKLTSDDVMAKIRKIINN